MFSINRNLFFGIKYFPKFEFWENTILEFLRRSSIYALDFWSKLPNKPENNTGFFEFDGTDEEMDRQYYGFRAQNESMINWAC